MLRLAILALIGTLAFACETGPRIWIPRSKTADPLYRFVKDDKVGYIDASGHVAIPPTFETYVTSEFHDGLLEVAVSDGKYVDRSGKIVIDKDFYRGWDFSEGLAVAMRRGENLWGYIDKTGEFAISPRFASSLNDYVWPFSDGMALIKVKSKFGYIDKKGAFVIEPTLLDGTDFSDGMARVVMEGPCVYFPDGPCGSFNPVFPGGNRGGKAPACKFTYIDKTGRVLTEERFDSARNFSEGLAPVRVGEKWGFIDKAGAIVISPRFEDAESFSSGLSRIRDHGLYGYADKTGSIRIKAQFKYAEDFSDGFAVVGNGDGLYR